MAYDYVLEMVSDLNSRQAKRLLAERLNANLSDEGFVYTDDISIAGHDPVPGHWTEVTEECFHFTPTLSMSFRAGRHEGQLSEKFYPLMLRGAMILLEHGRDAVMLGNGEVIIFQRLGGQLVFNADKTSHREAIIKQEVHVPYESRSLPSPLL